MRIFLTIVLLLLSLVSMATPPTTFYVSIVDDDWETAATWDQPSAPSWNQTDGNDNITIATNVLLSDNFTLKSGTVLTINAGDTLTITGDATFNNGSTMLVNGVLIIQGSVTNNNNSDDITINGTIIINGNYDGGNGSTIEGTGSMEIGGSVTTSGDGTVFGSDSDCITDCDNSADTPLPIELIYFGVRAYDSSVLIEWITASEVNNDRFIIERSSDGEDFEFVAEIDGAGNSSQEIKYSVTDNDPLNGDNYYRLTQVDYDGRSETFKLVYVNITPRSDKGFKLYPNPANVNTTINITSGGYNPNDEVLVVVNSIDGKLMYSKVILTDSNGEFLTAIDPHGRIPKGIYIVLGSSDDTIYSNVLVIEL